MLSVSRRLSLWRNDLHYSKREAMKELDNGDLVLDNGVIIPAEKRTRTEVYSRVVGYLRPVA